ncbi:YqcI/YcgG family protein [Salimicrobium sp. PL1-032A]|uniref:YqcI/YcgG family protein n=1 Tax=Salimicrobium sp. PL1-032A TaxID=3095364 RepID=UPI003260356F
MGKRSTSRLLTKQYIEDGRNKGGLPDWFLEEYETFTTIVTDPTFPCFFGMRAQHKGELRYTYLEKGKWDHFPDTVEDFLKLFRKPCAPRHGMFIFIEPEDKERNLDFYRARFWDILQYLHEKDRVAWPSSAPRDPEHHLWDFHFAGEPIFTFGNAPAYKQRKTRNLGNSLILGFQPRRIFQGLEGTEPGGIMSREKVRERVEKWDRLPKHPDISHFGDPDHNEWKQSFIGDDIEPIKGKCPFLHKNYKEST